MSKTGINFERCNVVSAQLHNERDAAYLESVRASGKATYELFDDRTPMNTTWHNSAYEGKTLEQILEDCRERYRQAVGQEPQEQDRVRKVKDKKTGLYKEVTTAGWSPIREGVCPIREGTTIEDFAPVTAWLEERGVHVISISLHVDEGYQDPVTGDRRYNRHAHIIADWTDHATGKTAKLGKADMSELQTVLADALGMERGESKEVTGKDHLTPAQQREKAAAENAARLETRAADLENQVKANQEEADRALRSLEEAQQREAEAIEKARTAEKAASREQLRSNAADIGARILGLFGRGAVAEANAERDDAQERAEAAEKQAAADREAAESAEKARILAVESAKTARQAKTRAEREKAEYGRQMYENGVADGVKQGRQSVQASIAPLQQQLAQKQDVIDQLQRSRDEKAEELQQEIEDMQAWNPNMKNWRQSLADMREAGMKKEDIVKVFRNGAANVTLTLMHNYREHKVETHVAIGTLQTAANTKRHGVWFKFQESWYSVKSFLSKALEHIRSLNPSKSMHL